MGVAVLVAGIVVEGIVGLPAARFVFGEGRFFWGDRVLRAESLRVFSYSYFFMSLRESRLGGRLTGRAHGYEQLTADCLIWIE